MGLKPVQSLFEYSLDRHARSALVTLGKVCQRLFRWLACSSQVIHEEPNKPLDQFSRMEFLTLFRLHFVKQRRLSLLGVFLAYRRCSPRPNENFKKWLFLSFTTRCDKKAGAERNSAAMLEGGGDHAYW